MTKTLPLLVQFLFRAVRTAYERMKMSKTRARPVMTTMRRQVLKCAADFGFVPSIASSDDIVVVRRKVKVEVLAVLRNLNLKFSRY